jgi:hypothetical protein
MHRRAIAPLLALALPGLVAACAARAPFDEPGHAGPRGREPAPRPSSPPAASWDRWSQVRAWPDLAPPFPAHGHFGGEYDLRVTVDPDSAAAYLALAPATRLATGSIAVARHVRRGSGEAGPVFAMVKREPGFHPAGGDWEYLVLDAGGVVIDRGALPACARCHAESPSDHLFGLPRDAGRR